MRRSLAISVAAATAITASAASFAPARRPRRRLWPAISETGVELIRDGDGGVAIGIAATTTTGGTTAIIVATVGTTTTTTEPFPGFYFAFGFPQAYYQPRRTTALPRLRRLLPHLGRTADLPLTGAPAAKTNGRPCAARFRFRADLGLQTDTSAQTMMRLVQSIGISRLA